MKLSAVRSFPDCRRRTNGGRGSAASGVASIGIHSRYPPRKDLISVSGMRPASVEFPLVTCQGSDGLRHASVVSRDSQQNRLTMAVPAPTRQNTTGCERPLTTNDKSGNNQPPTDRPVSLIACHHSQPTILTHRTAAERVRCVHIVSPHSQPTIRTPTTNQRTALHTIDYEPPLTTNHLDDFPPCTRRTRTQPIACCHSQPTA